MRPYKNDYVVATKYSDGDPGDHYCVGFYRYSWRHYNIETRHIVVDSKAVQFRHNGFRRCEKITSEQGRWLVDHFPLIEAGIISVWWYVKHWNLPKPIFRLKHKISMKDAIEKREQNEPS